MPLVTPEKARNIDRSLKAMADQHAEAGDLGLARNMQRQSEWYLAYRPEADDAVLPRRSGTCCPSPLVELLHRRFGSPGQFVHR